MRGGAPPLPLGREGGGPVAVELEEVVGGGDQSPFRAAGRSAAALKALDLAVELQLAEDRLDRGLALPVKRAPLRGREHAAHGVIETASPSRARAAAQARVG